MKALRPLRCRRPSVDEFLLWTALAAGFLMLLVALASAQDPPKPRPACLDIGSDISAADKLAHALDGLGRVAVVSGNTQTLAGTLQTLNDAAILLRIQSRMLATSTWRCVP